MRVCDRVDFARPARGRPWDSVNALGVGWSRPQVSSQGERTSVLGKLGERIAHHSATSPIVGGRLVTEFEQGSHSILARNS